MLYLNQYLNCVPFLYDLNVIFYAFQNSENRIYYNFISLIWSTIADIFWACFSQLTISR